VFTPLSYSVLQQTDEQRKKPLRLKTFSKSPPNPRALEDPPGPTPAESNAAHLVRNIPAAASSTHGTCDTAKRISESAIGSRPAPARDFPDGSPPIRGSGGESRRRNAGRGGYEIDRIAGESLPWRFQGFSSVVAWSDWRGFVLS